VLPGTSALCSVPSVHAVCSPCRPRLISKIVLLSCLLESSAEYLASPVRIRVSACLLMAPVPVLVPSCAVSPHAVAQSCRHIFVLLLSRLLQLAHEHLASPCKNVVPFKRAAWHPVPVPVPGSAHLLPHVVAHSLSLHCVATQLRFVAVSASRSRFSCNVSPSVCCLAPVHGARPISASVAPCCRPQFVSHILLLLSCFVAVSASSIRSCKNVVPSVCRLAPVHVPVPSAHLSPCCRPAWSPDILCCHQPRFVAVSASSILASPLNRVACLLHGTSA
jgi:hypothetical protein